MAMITLFNTQEYMHDVYSLFNHIKDNMVYSKKNNLEITIMWVADGRKMRDYVNNCTHMTYDGITAVAWKFAQDTAAYYERLALQRQ